MWCTRWFLPLLLLPLPTAPPYFLLLFLLSLAMNARPCFYCVVLLSAIFVSSCYWQPLPLDSPLAAPWEPGLHTFRNALVHELGGWNGSANANSSTVTSILMSTSTKEIQIPFPKVIRAVDRCWCDLASGRLFEPFDVAGWERASVRRLGLELVARAVADARSRGGRKGGSEVGDEEWEEKVEDVERTEGRTEPEPLLSVLRSAFWRATPTLAPASPPSPHPTSTTEHEHSGHNRTSSPSHLEPSAQGGANEHPSSTPQSPLLDLNPSLGVLRPEYDLKPYGFGLVLDFRWARKTGFGSVV